ncbi:MAG: hypothetical protein JST68_09705 [Bacteroidetes bacterium]|nr:hypothetical protein [Bacteroidota bacterium]
MKHVYLLLIAFICSHASWGQSFNNIYEDARQLKTFIDVGPPVVFRAGDAAKWGPIFKKYYGDTVSSFTSLQAALKGNPFGLGDYLPQAVINPLFRERLEGSGTQPFNAFSPQALAGALTQVIIKRAKEELTATFFQQMKQELKDNPELATLFPQTAAFIQHIDAYLYAGFLNTLRQAFVQDITNLNAQIKPFLYSDRIKAYIDGHPNLRFVYLAIPVGNLVAGISKKEGLANSIRYLYPDPAIKGFNENVYTAMAMFATVSESVRDAGTGKDWISFSDFQRDVLNDPVTSNIFFGLLYESVKNLTINGKSIGTLVTPDNKAGVVAIFKGLLNIYQNVQGGLAAIKAKVDGGKPLTVDDIQYIGDVSIKVLQTVLKDVSGFVRMDATEVARLQSVLAACQSMLQVANNISQSNYSSAVMNFLIMTTDLLSIDSSRGDASVLMQKLLKYGSFMAAVSEAKNTDELSAALDAAILPTGSSSIKHYSSFSISINSYIGAGYYAERYNSGNPSHVKFSLPTLGVSLPVGVGFNWGIRSKVIGAASLFVSVIDLGAVASFKLSTPDSVQSSSLPDFTWKNLLAPGGYVVLGRILNTPLSIGLGAQKGPQLRSISYNQAGGSSVSLDEKQVLRFGGFVSVDIPLFNIYSKAWKKPLSD